VDAKNEEENPAPGLTNCASEDPYSLGPVSARGLPERWV